MEGHLEEATEPRPFTLFTAPRATTNSANAKSAKIVAWPDAPRPNHLAFWLKPGNLWKSEGIPVNLARKTFEGKGLDNAGWSLTCGSL